jgi:hypothetical protein
VRIDLGGKRGSTGFAAADAATGSSSGRGDLVVVPYFPRSLEPCPYVSLHQRVRVEASRYPFIRVIDRYDEFRAVGRGGRFFSSDGMHPNELGRRMIGEAIARAIRSEGTAAESS